MRHPGLRVRGERPPSAVAGIMSEHSSASFEYSLRKVSGVVIAEFTGRLTPSDEEITSLKETFQDQLDRGNRLFLINLEHIDLTNSAGIGLLLMIRKAATDAGGDLMCCGVQDRASRIFKAPGLKPAIPMDNDCEKALEALQKKLS